jgi:hypothetical protein
VTLHRDVGRRRERIAAGRARASCYTWARVGRETWAVYRAALEERGKGEVPEEPAEGTWPPPVR